MALSLKDKLIADVDLLDGIDSTGFLASTVLDDTAYGAGWDGDTTHVPTKNALYGALEGKQDTLTFGIANTNAVKVDGSVINGDAAFFTSSGVKSLPASSARNALSVPAKSEVIADTGWQSFPYAITYESDNVFSVPMDDGPRYPIGTRVQITQGSPKFFVISKVGLFSGGKTTFTLDGGGTYTFTSAPFSSAHYSRVLAPMGIDNDIVAQGLWKTVRIDLLPATTDTHSIGSATYKWKDLHLSGDANVGGKVNAISGYQKNGTDIFTGGSSLPFTNMPYVGSAPIVAQGSNANGHYIKFADGTLICRTTLEMGSIVKNGAGTWADPYKADDQNWTFPMEFSAKPTIAMSGYVNSGVATRKRYLTYYQTANATTLTAASVLRIGSDSSDVNAFISVIAIGISA